MKKYVFQGIAAVLVLFVLNQTTWGQGTVVKNWLKDPDKWNVPEELREDLEDLRISTEVSEQLTASWDQLLADRKFVVNRAKTSEERLAHLRQVLEEALAAVDLEAARKGNWGRFRESLALAKKRMEPLARFAREYTVYILGNAHIDMAWLWRWRETVEVCRATFAQQLQLMDLYPDFVFAQSQAQAYRWMEEQYPEIFAGIRQRVKEGRWEITGGMVVEPDCNLIGGESWVRQLLYGKLYFAEKFGTDVTLGWNPDSFGYNWNMPQFLRKSGITAFITQKISWNDTNRFPYHLFWWVGADGSRVLTYFPYTGYVGRLRIKEITSAIRQNELNTGRKDVLVLFGFGDHGGGPEKQMLESYLKYKKATVFPNIQFIRAHDYIARLMSEDLSNLPEWRDELYLEYHRGTYTTQAAVKAANRKSEILLANAEKVAALMGQFGAPYPQEVLRENWWKVLFNQFHDILPGSGIAPIYRDALEDYRNVFTSVNGILVSSLRLLASQVKISPGMPQERFLLVFNPLNWPRTDVVYLPLPGASGVEILTAEGNPVASQILADETGRWVVFVAEDVPSFGYAVFRVRNVAKVAPAKVNPERNIVEGRYFRLEVDRKSGNIRSIYDKVNAREVLDGSGEGNLIHLYEDKPKQWDAWNIGYTGKDWKLNRADEVRLLDDGPVFARIRVRKSFLGPAKQRYAPTKDFPSSFFIQDIILYKNLPYIEVRMQIDWWEEHVLAKLEIPVNVQADSATYEIPNAAIRRPTTMNNSWERARFEVPALRWIDLSDGSYGVSLITDSKYGYDIHGNRMRITLLRSPSSPDPTADRGKHTFRYAIYPHAGDWRTAGTVRLGHQFNNALLIQPFSRGKGGWPVRRSFVTMDADNVVLDALKKPETGNGWIFRFYEAHGTEAGVECELWGDIRQAVETDFLEHEQGPVEWKGKKLHLKFSPFETKTVRVIFEEEVNRW